MNTPTSLDLSHESIGSDEFTPSIRLTQEVLDNPWDAEEAVVVIVKEIREELAGRGFDLSRLAFSGYDLDRPKTEDQQGDDSYGDFKGIIHCGANSGLDGEIGSDDNPLTYVVDAVYEGRPGLGVYEFDQPLSHGIHTLSVTEGESRRVLTINL